LTAIAVVARGEVDLPNPTLVQKMGRTMD